MSTYRAVFLGFLVAAIVLVIGDARRGNSAVVVPNQNEITYSIPAGGSSAPISIPASNTPVTVNLAVTTGPARGTCSVVVCYTTAAPALLVWSGHVPNANAGGIAIGGSTTVLGTTIAPLNGAASVLLRVSNALNRLEIVNNSDATVSAVMEQVY